MCMSLGIALPTRGKVQLTEEIYRIALSEKYQVGNACVFPFSFGVLVKSS